jgi:hypothetical protein
MTLIILKHDKQPRKERSGLLSYYIYVINILPSYIQSSLFCYFIISMT